MATSRSEEKRESYTEYRTPTQEQIARHARELWERAGRPEGRDVEFWLNAERALHFPTNLEEEKHPTVPPTDPPPLGAPQATHPAKRSDVMQRSAVTPQPGQPKPKPARP